MAKPPNTTPGPDNNSKPETTPQAVASEVLVDLYAELLSSLEKLKQRRLAGEDEQVIVFEAVWQVKKFLDVNPKVRDAGLTRPFGLLLASIDHLRAGSPADLFRINSTAGGRPRDKSGTTALQAMAAAILELLCNAGENRKDGSEFIVRELGKFGYTRSGKAQITAATIIRWRDEMGARIIGQPRSLYKEIVEKMKQGLGIHHTADAVRKGVPDLIRALEDEGIPVNNKPD